MPTILGYVLLALALYFLRKALDNSSRLKRIPVPSGASFVWGHEWLEFEDDRGSQWKQWIKQCGKVFKIRGAWAHHDILCVADPKAIIHITCKNTYNYPHSAVFRPIIERLTGKGLAWVEGEKDHKPMRALLAPAFTLDRVKGMAPDIWVAVNGVVARLTQEIGDDGKEGKTLNMLDWTANSTLDVIGRVAFAHDFQQGQSPEAQLIMTGWRKQASLGMTFQGFISLLVLRQFPFIGSLPLPALKAQGAIRNTVRPLANKLIERGVNDLEKGRDVLSILLRANVGEDKEKRIPDDELLDHIVTFVIAGHETTSVVFNFTLWMLAQNPETQKRLREELLSRGDEPSFEDLWSTTTYQYLDAVTREGFRLFPPSTRNEKVAEQDDILPLATPIIGTDGRLIHEIPIKAGQVIHVPSIAVNRLDDVWGGDGDAFRPERWLVKEAAEVPDSNWLPGTWSSMMTFLLGPRSCLGYRLAVFEMKVLLFAFIRAFEFEVAVPIDTRFSATIQPRVVGREEEGSQLPLHVRVL